VADGGEHRVRAEAPGYGSETTVIAGVKDATIRLALTKQAKPGAASARPKATQTPAAASTQLTPPATATSTAGQKPPATARPLDPKNPWEN